MIRLISSFILIGFSAMLAAAPATIKSVRIWAAPENTRVVFDLDGPVDHKVTTLNEPARMVIDFEEAALINKLPGQGGRTGSHGSARGYLSATNQQHTDAS
jgi:hypothetical protein